MKNFKKLLAILVIALFYTGCNDWLESVDPATSISGEAVVSTPDGVNALRASMYSKIRRSFGYTTQYFVGPSAFTDETTNKANSSRFDALVNAVDGDGGRTHLGTWAGSAGSIAIETYGIIKDANIIINAVQPGVVSDALLDQYKGEALAIRALAKHTAVRAYGYEPGMFNMNPDAPNWNLGIVLRTDATLDVSDADDRERATVTEVYAQIMSDLAEAKTLLDGRNADRTVITESFVDGLMARVSLYAGEWADAYNHAANALSNAGLSLADTPDAVANVFAPNQPEALFYLSLNPQTEAIAGSNVNNGLAAYTSTQWVAQVPTQRLMDLFDANDYRLGDFVRDDDGEIVIDEDANNLPLYDGGWFRPCQNDQQSPPTNFVNDCLAANDLGLSSTKWLGRNGNMSDNIPYMRIAELYLIQAEAAAKRDGNVSGPAVTALNTLREARGLAPVAAGDFANLTAWEDEVLEERMRELFVEGHRFWDLKRLGRTIPNAAGDDKFRPDSYRMLAPIPESVVGQNPLILQNPGYN